MRTFSSDFSNTFHRRLINSKQQRPLPPPATVDILTDLTCSFLYSHKANLDNYQAILVKLSAGINNLLHRENVLSDISPQQFIDKLLFF
jgi:hypothetical protein